MKLFDNTLARLERSLDVRLARHNVLSGNVANVDTPGYAPKDVDFKAAMAEAGGAAGASASLTLASTDSAHMSAGVGGAGSVSVGPTGQKDIPLVNATGGSASLDGNKVDLDRTMVALAENGLQYGASARAAGKKLAILRYITSDGNG
jgi:flagellar basal-body rod protein FlgB